MAGVEDELDAWLAAGLVGLEEVCFLSSVLEDGLLPLLLEEVELEVDGFVLDLGFLVDELPPNICFIFFIGCLVRLLENGCCVAVGSLVNLYTFPSPGSPGSEVWRLEGPGLQT